MDGYPVFQCDHPQNAAFQFPDFSPESITIVFLLLDSNGILQDPDAPFLFEIRPLPQHLILEVIRKPVSAHRLHATSVANSRQSDLRAASTCRDV